LNNIYSRFLYVKYKISYQITIAFGKMKNALPFTEDTKPEQHEMNPIHTNITQT